MSTGRRHLVQDFDRQYVPAFPIIACGVLAERFDRRRHTLMPARATRPGCKAAAKTST